LKKYINKQIYNPLLKRLVFTVTNSLHYDQRMIRICTTLAEAGYRVTLVGVQQGTAQTLAPQPFGQKRLYCPFKKGFAFYAYYNVRLFFYLLFKPADILCCIDLDTLLPVFFAAKLRGKKVVYDAHEYFTQQKEVVTRPKVYRVWHWIEKTFVPRIKHGYTVSYTIAAAFKKLYAVSYEVVMNCTVLKLLPPHNLDKGKKILYQGAVNEARGLEYLIPAMRQIDANLYIYGDGNMLETCLELVKQYGVEQKIFFMGKVLPTELAVVTADAYIGLNLVENTGLNQYYSLANKFFDYMHQAVPQVTMAFPEYERINQQFEVAVLIDDLSEQNIANAVNHLLDDTEHYGQLQQNCIRAREVYCWQQEAVKLLQFYQQLSQ
jgi:glycosyltransferase involved in cell wall biosynthesis